MKVLFGLDVAQSIYRDLKFNFNIVPKFCIIQIGDNISSTIYIKHKIEAAKKLNFDFEYVKFPEEISLEKLIEFVQTININDSIHGIIIQLPLPKHLLNILDYINPEKDIDGLTKEQQANLYLNKDGLYPCTAMGVINLLKYYNITIENKKISVLGRSNLVGKPLALLFSHYNGLVSLIHSKISIEKTVKELQSSDIICSAIGSANFIKPDMIKENAILIDIGCSSYNGEILGDIDKGCYEKALAYTPMPKGMGPVTVAMLMHNIFKAYKKQTL